MSKTLQILIVKYLTKQASLSELDELSKQIENTPNKEELIEYIKINYAIDFNLKKFNTDHSKKQLLQFIEKEKRILNRLKAFNLMKYAAVLLLLLSVGYLFQKHFVNDTFIAVEVETTSSTEIGNQIIVGSNKAVLTLEDGSSIDLEKGKEIQAEHLKSNGEELQYNSTNSKDSRIAYNYLTVPRGGQFHIKLADGTLVWLNSESRLKYPVSFIEGVTRNVELVYGEAYFEVSPSTEHNGATFKVLSSSQEIEVLGTEFNVKAYQDESNTYTTLVEGQVSISTDTSKHILEPNQQSNVSNESSNITIRVANVADEIAWKKGLFSFKGKPLGEIFKVLSRWYDVDFMFSNPDLKNVKFNGVLNKKEAIEEILNSILTTKTIQAYEIKNKIITIK